MDDIQIFLEFIHIQPEFAEQGLVSVGFQIFKVITHEINKHLIPVISQCFYLDEETFLRGSGCNTHRIE